MNKSFHFFRMKVLNKCNCHMASTCSFIRHCKTILRSLAFSQIIKGSCDPRKVELNGHDPHLACDPVICFKLCVKKLLFSHSLFCYSWVFDTKTLAAVLWWHFLIIRNPGHGSPLAASSHLQSSTSIICKRNQQQLLLLRILTAFVIVFLFIYIVDSPSTDC